MYMTGGAHNHSMAVARVCMIYRSARRGAGIADPDAVRPDIVELDRR